MLIRELRALVLYQTIFFITWKIEFFENINEKTFIRPVRSKNVSCNICKTSIYNRNLRLCSEKPFWRNLSRFFFEISTYKCTTRLSLKSLTYIMKMQIHKNWNTPLWTVSVGDPEDSERTYEPRSEINRQKPSV